MGAGWPALGLARAKFMAIGLENTLTLGSIDDDTFVFAVLFILMYHLIWIDILGVNIYSSP